MYEAYEDPAGPLGAHVSLAVNGLRTLDALGCLEPVRRAGFSVARQLMWSGRGKLLGDVARGRRPEDPWHSITLLRAELVTALRDEALRCGARIVTGHRLAGSADPLRAATAVRAATAGHVVTPVTRRHQGKTVLIGDAAHPADRDPGTLPVRQPR